jgi:phosphoglycolate phosphatase
MKPPRPIQAVLFDLDGTLIDSAPDLGAAADKMRIDRGLPSLPLAHYRPMAGAGARGMLQLAFGITPEDAAYNDLRDEFFANYEAALTVLTHPFEGVPELVQALLRHPCAWGVVTNKMERFTHPIVQGMALFDTAGAVVCGDTTPYPKPHPAPLIEAAQRMGVDPAHCVYVGDDERDIVAGLAAGMWTVAAHYGYLGQGAPASDWGAHADIHSPLALLKILELD